jgi:glycine reductase
MMGKEIRVVHYVNQFFGQQGGEDMAGMGFLVREGPVGPGIALERTLGSRGKVVGTVICGDNYFAENIDRAAEDGAALAAAFKPDVFIAGPAFEAGRYGIACGAISKSVARRCGIPAVTGMAEENPGVELYRRDIYIVRTQRSALKVAENLRVMAELAMKVLSGGEGTRLVAREAIGRPSEDGYFPRGVVKNEYTEKTAAERGVDMLLAKLAGRPFETELPLPAEPGFTPAPPIKKPLSRCEIALVSDGGLVPKENPHGMRGRGNLVWAAYELDTFLPDNFASEDYYIAHTGYYSVYVLEDPNRMVPADTMRELEREGVIGKLHPLFYSTSGNGTVRNRCWEMGTEIVKSLQEKGVDGAILTST